MGTAIGSVVSPPRPAPLTPARIFLSTDAAANRVPAGSSAATPLAALAERLQHEFKPRALGKWGLEHRLYRSTARPAAGQPQPPQHQAPPKQTEQAQYQHVLHLSHARRAMYVGFEAAPDRRETEAHQAQAAAQQQARQAQQSQQQQQQQNGSAAARLRVPRTAFRVAQVPLPSKESYLKALNQDTGRLWLVRTIYQVASQGDHGGAAFECGGGSFVARVGEVRMVGQMPRALILAVEVPLDKEVGEGWGEEDEEACRLLPREVLERVGFESARESWGFGGEEAVVRAWCDVLKTQ
jgi:hypothetical protein